MLVLVVWGASAANAAAVQPGISVSGPTTVAFNTTYRYQVTVVTNRSYRRASLGFYTLDCLQRRVINLTAHRPWRGSFVMIFSADRFQSDPAVVAALVSPARPRPPFAHTLFHVSLSLTALSEAGRRQHQRRTATRSVMRRVGCRGARASQLYASALGKLLPIQGYSHQVPGQSRPAKPFQPDRPAPKAFAALGVWSPCHLA